jgi:hypothetical protein
LNEKFVVAGRIEAEELAGRHESEAGSHAKSILVFQNSPT